MSVLHRRGFTLLEVAVFVAVLTITIGTLLPVISRPYVSEYRVQTMAEMQAIQRAILGDPANGDYGFLGTMGRLPRAGTLSELWIKPSDMNAVSLSADTGVLNGWNGPYLRALFHRPEKDAWGQDYVLETSTNETWRVRSWGPDGTANTSDDIVLSRSQTTDEYFGSQGTVTLSLLLSDGQMFRPVSNAALTNNTGDPTKTEVKVFYPRASDATEESVACTVDALNSTATCLNVPFGLRHFRVSSTDAVFPTVDVNIPVLRLSSTGRVFLDPADGTNAAHISDTYSIPITGVAGLPTTIASGVLPVTIGVADIPTSIPVHHALDVQAAGSVRPTSDTAICTVSVKVKGSVVTESEVTISSGSATPMTIPFQVLANRAMATASELERSLGISALAVEIAVKASGGNCELVYPAAYGQRFGSVQAYVVQ